MFQTARATGLSAFAAVMAWGLSAAPLAAAQRFQRGDSNGDARFDLSDGIHTLGFLFLGSPAALRCSDAADSNDDGNVDISDALHMLGYLFIGTPAPPSPFGGCGEDPTTDALTCASFEPCPAPSVPPTPPVLQPPASPTREGSIELRGTAGPGLLITVTGGKRSAMAPAGADGAFSLQVELIPNRLNRLYAVAEDSERRTSAPAALEVIQDSEPPFVFVDEPTAGSKVMTDRVTVTGRVSDMLSGFLGLSVTVNGEPAQIAIGIGTNGTFERQDVPLALGANRIRIVAADVVGNTAAREVSITREEPPAGSDWLEAGDGNGQKARIHATLPLPIAVRARRADGAPIPGKLVTFQVVRSDGRLSFRPDTLPEDRVMTLTSRTGADGLASSYWTLGSDAGCGNNRVKVTGEGLAGEVLFCASATPGPAAQINIGSGNNQRGEAGAPLGRGLEGLGERRL